MAGIGDIAKKVGGVLKYTSGLGPAVSLATSGGKKTSLPGPTGGGAKVPIPGRGKTAAKAPAAPTGSGLADALSRLPAEITDAYDVEGLTKYYDWLNDPTLDDTGKTERQGQAAFLQSMGINPSFKKESATEGYNPLEAQTIFSDILAPHLSKITQQRNSIADQYTAAMGKIMGGNQLPPEYAGVLAAQVPQQAMEMKQQALAGEQLGMQIPALDMLVNQLKQSQNESAKVYYAQMAANAGGAAPAGAGSELGF